MCIRDRLASVLVLLIGSVYGSVAGFLGGKVDQMCIRDRRHRAQAAAAGKAGGQPAQNECQQHQAVRLLS